MTPTTPKFAGEINQSSAMISPDRLSTAANSPIKEQSPEKTDRQESAVVSPIRFEKKFDLFELADCERYVQDDYMKPQEQEKRQDSRFIEKINEIEEENENHEKDEAENVIKP